MFSNHNTIKLEISSGKKRKWKHVMYRNLYMNVYSSIIHNSQNTETTQMSTNGQMDEQNLGYPCNGVFLDYNKE